jgi:thioredoxin 1
MDLFIRKKTQVYLSITNINMFRMKNVPPPIPLMPPENVITKMSKTEFLEAIQQNKGAIVLKFGAEWCGPCKQIEPLVYDLMSRMPENIKCACLDIDDEDSFDLYAYLKSKRMVNGVPVILCYKKGNLSWVPDNAVVGANVDGIRDLFSKCINIYSKEA